MSQDAGYSRYVAITKSDTVDFNGGDSTKFGAGVELCDAIYAGGAGIVVAVDGAGSAVNFTAVAGELIPIKARRVNSTTTTATLMVALYR